MLQLQHLKIRNFRHIGNLDIKFEPMERGFHGSFVIRGGQSSGKTAILTGLMAALNGTEQYDTAAHYRVFPLWNGDFTTQAAVELSVLWNGEGPYSLRVEFESEEDPKNPGFPMLYRVWHFKGPEGWLVSRKFATQDGHDRAGGDTQALLEVFQKIRSCIYFWTDAKSKSLYVKMESEFWMAARRPLTREVLSTYFGVPSHFNRHRSQDRDYALLWREGHPQGYSSLSRRESNFVNLVGDLLGGFTERVPPSLVVVDDLVDVMGPRALCLLQGALPCSSFLVTQGPWHEHPLLAEERVFDGEDKWVGTLRAIEKWPHSPASWEGKGSSSDDL